MLNFLILAQISRFFVLNHVDLFRHTYIASSSASLRKEASSKAMSADRSHKIAMDHDHSSCPTSKKAIELTVFDSLKAYLGLITIDLLIQLGGFPLLYRTIKRCGVSAKTNAGSAEIERACAAANKAGRYYFKHALCLQRSAVIAWMLRRRGIAATMVIGCRIMPYQGHAWVEVGGRVVSDTPEVQQIYQVLERV